jgi:hypothetical protein
LAFTIPFNVAVISEIFVAGEVVERGACPGVVKVTVHHKQYLQN